MGSSTMRVNEIVNLASYFEEAMNETPESESPWTGAPETLDESVGGPLRAAISNIDRGEFEVAKEHIQSSLDILKTVKIANSFSSFLKIANPIDHLNQPTNPAVPKPNENPQASTQEKPGATIDFVIGSLNFAMGFIESNPEKARSILIEAKRLLVKEMQSIKAAEPVEQSEPQDEPEMSLEARVKELEKFIK